MLSLYLNNDIRVFYQHIKKIEREKPEIIALQGVPRLSEDQRIDLILGPVSGEYNLYRGDILHKTDNLLLVRRDLYKVELVRDNSANDWILQSQVSMVGLLLKPKSPNMGHTEQVVFSVYVEPGTDANDIINNAYFIRKVLSNEKLSVKNLIFLGEHLDDESSSLFKRVLDMEIDAGSKRRVTRKR